MTTDSTTTDLERRAIEAGELAIAGVGYVRSTDKRYFVEAVARAVLKAHAEWLDRNELEIRAKPPFNFTVNLLEETKSAAQQEDQSHD